MTGALHPVVKTSLFMRFPHFMCELGKVLLPPRHRDYQLCVSPLRTSVCASSLSDTCLACRAVTLAANVFLVDAHLSLYLYFDADTSSRISLDFSIAEIVTSYLTLSNISSYYYCYLVFDHSGTLELLRFTTDSQLPWTELASAFNSLTSISTVHRPHGKHRLLMITSPLSQ
jgi:hypothetical protein